MIKTLKRTRKTDFAEKSFAKAARRHRCALAQLSSVQQHNLVGVLVPLVGYGLSPKIAFTSSPTTRENDLNLTVKKRASRTHTTEFKLALITTLFDDRNVKYNYRVTIAWIISPKNKHVWWKLNYLKTLNIKPTRHRLKFQSDSHPTTIVQLKNKMRHGSGHNKKLSFRTFNATRRNCNAHIIERAARRH